MSTSNDLELSKVLHKVSFVTSVYENDWREILLTDRLKNIVESVRYDFEYRFLVVNNKEISTELLTAIDTHIQNGIIDQVLFSSVWGEFILQRFNIELSFVNYNSLVQNLIAIHFCPTDYLFWLNCGSEIPSQPSWLDDAITIIDKASNIAMASPVWNNDFSSVKKASAEELDDFYVGHKIFERCYLLPVTRYRDELYSYKNSKTVSYLDSAECAFEEYINLWMETKKRQSIAHKKISYQSCECMGGEPEELFLQKKHKVADWINDGLSFETIYQRVSDGFYNLLESKNFYHYSARCFSQRNDKYNALKSLKVIVEKWPNASVVSRRIINAFDEGVVELNGLKFSLDQDVLSLHMQLVIARGDYEAGELEMLCKYARPSDRVLELGAGVGFVGINYLNRNPDHYYVACEANPHLIRLIEKNQALNNIKFNVENLIFDDYDGHVDFYITEDFWASSLVKPDEYQEKHRIDVKNINHFIKKHKINTLIMDIEGAEYELIKKIDLDNLNKIVLEMHANVYGVKGMHEIVQHLKDKGFALPPGKWNGGIIMMYHKSRFSLNK